MRQRIQISGLKFVPVNSFAHSHREAALIFVCKAGAAPNYQANIIIRIAFISGLIQGMLNYSGHSTSTLYSC